MKRDNIYYGTDKPFALLLFGIGFLVSVAIPVMIIDLLEWNILTILVTGLLTISLLLMGLSAFLFGYMIWKSDCD